MKLRLKLYSYEAIMVPQGVGLRKADKIVSKDRLFMALDSYSPFSNLFRYELLLQKGGWWVDADVLCLRRPDPCQPSEIYAWEDARYINCGQIRLKKGSIIAESAVRKLSRIDFSKIDWGETGPRLTTEVIKELELHHLAAERQVFYPIHWAESYKLIFHSCAAEIANLLRSSSYMHAYGSMYKAIGFDLRRHKPQRGSFLDQVYEAYGVYSRYHLAEPDWSPVVNQLSAYLEQPWLRQYRELPCDVSLHMP